MSKYEINELIYINVHSLCIFLSQDKHFKNRKMDEKVAEYIINFIDKYEAIFFIIDLKKIDATKKPFEKFKKYFNGEVNNKKVIFVNVELDSIKRDIEEKIGEIINAASYDDFQLSSDIINQDYEKIRILNYRTERMKILHKYLIEESKKTNLENKDEKLISSNLYANYYICIKTFFKDADLFFKIIYELCLDIEEKNLNPDYIVASSNNGSVLAAGISKMLGLKAIYLQNVGPLLSVNDIKMYDRIQPDKNCVYVYDFICLGSELIRTMFALELKGSKITGAVGVSKFIDPFRLYDTKPIHVNYLFAINEFNFNYECYFDKKKGEKNA